MTDHELKILKEILYQQQQKILELQETLNDAARPVELDQASVGRLSRMDAMQGQNMALASKRRTEQHLKRILATLQRFEIEDEDYGFCCDCGDEIDFNRLKYDPTVLRCCRCQQKRDI